TGKLAQLAGGAVTVSCGDTLLLVTATMSKKVREGISFFPLTVDFEERLYAVGRIPGSFFRREGRPTEPGTLTMRLTDRALRPLFPKDLRNDVQVVITPLSQDEENYLDVLAVVGASAALMISDIPFKGPVGALRMGFVDGELIVSPTVAQVENGALDLKLAGTADALVMVEAGANEVSESVIVEALRTGHEAMQELIRVQEEMREKLGKPKSSYEPYELPKELVEAVRQKAGDQIGEVAHGATSKEERDDRVRKLQSTVVESLEEEWDARQVIEAFSNLLKDAVRQRIVKEGVRPDGRAQDEIRSLSAEVALLPRTHGSGLFNRGETQVLSVATLGTPREEQMLDDIFPEDSKRYMHHYNFPPYSTGETRPMRGPRRREIGHGALAQRALLPVIPPVEEFPYTIRVVSEALSSNGSTSMASVCGSTLALMDAGVALKSPVAGIAMGLIVEGGDTRVLTDIQGLEDHFGDMDFKVAGTSEGITALQMDIKVTGISYELLVDALEQARQARLQILDVIKKTIPEPRAEMSEYAPRMTILHIDPDKLGAVIGQGGKTVRSLQEECDVRIDIEDDGTIYIASTSGAGAEKAQRLIEELTEEAEIGKIYTGRVVRNTDFGSFVQILPGVDGLVHISQLASERVESVESVVKVGDEIMVMVTDVSPDGKIRLSRKAVLEGWTAEEARAADRPSGRRSDSRNRNRRPPRRS
ncbi:MAG: polyribonucleotide nucleotidyltransferase, partial [Anaerolineales bacterium]